ncbi:lytic transglycosylase domain-containing protein [Polymorphum gilvum]|uniref:Lytic transglycosylase catalytic n=1 Tax=Polymorphum gilvum (strain LMG 25793 / CGMCC 1.9160 / SL003B-26A1) TaxID=991905 RepID=F2J1I0_POLGS|nr:transglycosylase SLT domain-containing protein [Polymorphum gilvum]ADZ69762.1 Lytic transglycosylase catalytic [Polymorphum gilvum SL003B-26A1]
MIQSRIALRRAGLGLIAAAFTFSAALGPVAAASGADAQPAQDEMPQMQEVLVEHRPGSPLVPALRPADEEIAPALVVAKAEAKAGAAGKKSRSRLSPAARAAGGIDELIRDAARRHGVPVDLAHAVVRVESNYNPKARGSAGEVGLMQIKPATARGIGYRGSASALYDPATNLEWGMRYLAAAHKLASGDTCGTILRYNAGHFAKRMNPVSRRYCSKVKQILAST